MTQRPIDDVWLTPAAAHAIRVGARRAAEAVRGLPGPVSVSDEHVCELADGRLEVGCMVRDASGSDAEVVLCRLAPEDWAWMEGS